jgi:hypothetical protein
MKVRTETVVSISFFLISIIGGAIYLKYRQMKLLSVLSSEYSKLDLNDSIDGRITHVFHHPHLERITNTVFITIDDSLKQEIRVNYYKPTHIKRVIGEIVERGAFISKRPQIDSVCILNRNKSEIICYELYLEKITE